MGDGLHAGQARDLHTARRAAVRIAELTALAEREAYFERIPQGWQAMVAHLAKIAIASHIADEIQGVEARRAALCAVPAAWMDEVRWHVLRLWRTREIRAQHLAKEALQRERGRAGA